MPVDTGKIKEFADISKDKVAKETEISSTINESETQSAEKPVKNFVPRKPSRPLNLMTEFP